MANDIQALIPEWWAFESLRILTKNLVVANLVNRDYDGYFAKGGDVVNINRTGTFTAVRNQKGSPIVIQDAIVEGDTVKLNQHLHVSFELDDRDIQSSFVDLKTRFMVPAARALAEGIDLILMGEVYNFLGTTAGTIGAAVGDPALRDLNEAFTRNLIPRDGRNLIIGPSTENDMLGIDQFNDVAPRSDSPILNGWIGRARSFDIYVANQTSEVSAPGIVVDSSSTTVTAAGVKGQTVLGVTSTLVAATFKVGTMITIVGDMHPQLVTNATFGGGGSTLNSVTVWPGLQSATLSGAVVNVYQHYATSNGTTLPVNYSGPVELAAVSGLTALKIGQGVYLAGNMYMITGITDDGTNITAVTLNRPLDAAVPTGSILGPVPPANYNLAIIPDAVTLVNRPMRPADVGTGVSAGFAAAGNIALRVTIGYNMNIMKYVITLDTLCGVKTLNQDMGGVLLA
jgi:hypothetical protein